MKPKTILIADDNEHIREALTSLLEDEGYSLQEVGTGGQETLEVIQKTRPDLVLLDIMMPGINGYDVCREIKKDPQLAQTQIIFLTAKGQAYEQEHGKAIGAVDYLVKPFSPLQLIATIKRVLGD